MELYLIWLIAFFVALCVTFAIFSYLKSDPKDYITGLIASLFWPLVVIAVIGTLAKNFLIWFRNKMIED